jgi:hypothetical protein
MKMVKIYGGLRKDRFQHGVKATTGEDILDKMLLDYIISI